MLRVGSKYILTFKEPLNGLLNIGIIICSNKIQLLHKQQFVNYFAKNLKLVSAIFYEIFIFHQMIVL